MEEQIKSYKQRVGDLKQQMEVYAADLNRSNQKYLECCKERDAYFSEHQKVGREMELTRMQLAEREKDVDGLSDKIKKMESRHLCEINELRSSFEFTKRSVLDSQIRELTAKFN